MGVVIFMSDMNLNQKKNNRVTSDSSENNGKSGFLGTIDGFTGLANEIKSIKTKSLNVRYKSKNVNNSMFKATDGSSTLDIFLPVVFDEKIEQSIEECQKYNKLMWKKYRNGIADQDKSNEAYQTHKTDFENSSYTVENFKYQCEFYDQLIDKFIDEHHLKVPERKRAASIFFYILMGLNITFFCLCICTPGLLTSFAATLGISAVFAAKIIVASYVIAPIIALICFKLARYISWRQNDYEKDTNPELYSKYNYNLKRHKINCSRLTGERFETECYQYNYNEKKAQDCPLYWYYHDKDGKLKKNTKTPLELLLELKKAYEIPKQFKNTESKAFYRVDNWQ